jgi:hypothetical protein
MAVSNYTYLKPKIQGPNGVITVDGLADGEAILESATLVADLDGLANEIPDPKHHAGSFEPAEDIKLVPLDPTDPKGKALSISATLDPK